MICVFQGAALFPRMWRRWVVWAWREDSGLPWEITAYGGAGQMSWRSPWSQATQAWLWEHDVCAARCRCLSWLGQTSTPQEGVSLPGYMQVRYTDTIEHEFILQFISYMNYCFCVYVVTSKTAPFPWASYQIRKIVGCACAGNAGNVSPRRRFQRKPLVSDPGMHHGTCVTHVPWCMSGSLTRGDGENVPGIPGACAPAILRIWQEAHDVYSLSANTYLVICCTYHC